MRVQRGLSVHRREAGGLEKGVAVAEWSSWHRLAALGRRCEPVIGEHALIVFVRARDPRYRARGGAGSGQRQKHDRSRWFSPDPVLAQDAIVAVLTSQDVHVPCICDGARTAGDNRPRNWCTKYIRPQSPVASTEDRSQYRCQCECANAAFLCCGVRRGAGARRCRARLAGLRRPARDASAAHRPTSNGCGQCQFGDEYQVVNRHFARRRDREPCAASRRRTVPAPGVAHAACARRSDANGE